MHRPTYSSRYLVTLIVLLMLVAIVNIADKELLAPVAGAVLGGWLVDRLRQRTDRAPVWVALMAMCGGLVMAVVVFNLFHLGPLMAAAFGLGLVSYMVMPAVNVTMFSVVPPETKATSVATSNIILNTVIAVLSLLIGAISDATELRWAFAGAVLLMFSLGILVCLALLRTVRRDMARQQALVRSRTSAR